MVRKELKVAPSELSDGELRSVWVSLDDDGSGHVSAGEFGKFMRRGQDAVRTDRRTPQQRALEANRELADAVRYEKQVCPST